MKKLKILLSILLLMMATSLYAGKGNTQNSIFSVISSAMENIVKGEVESGINKVIPYTINPKAQTIEVIGKFVAKRKKYDQRYGKSLEYQLVKTQTIGENVIKYLFLESLENQIIKWTFVVYKPKNKWKVLTFKWDVSMGELFE